MKIFLLVESGSLLPEEILGFARFPGLSRDFVRLGIEALQRLPPRGGRRRCDSPAAFLAFVCSSLAVVSLGIVRAAGAEGVMGLCLERPKFRFLPAVSRMRRAAAASSNVGVAARQLAPGRLFCICPPRLYPRLRA